MELQPLTRHAPLPLDPAPPGAVSGARGPLAPRLRLIQWLLLVLVMGALLIPRTGVSLFAVMILAVPVAYSGVKDYGAFRWWAVYVLGFTVFAKLRDWADLVMPIQVQYPILMDKVVGLGAVPTVWLQARLYTPGSPSWLDYASLAVYLTHFVAFPFVGIAVWKLRPDRLKPYLVGFTACTLASVLIHFLLPTAPPWMAGQMGQLPVVYGILGDVLGGSTPGFYEYGVRVAGGNSVAAMPSVHAAAAMMIGLAGVGRWRYLGFGYVLAMSWSLVYLGQHYLIDAVVGCALAYGCWWLIAPRDKKPQSRTPTLPDR